MLPQTDSLPLWDGKPGTCRRFGFGSRHLDGLIAAGKVQWRQLTPGARTSKLIINQPSVASYLEALPCKKVPDSIGDKRGRPRRKLRRTARRAA